jgi:7,8-dihydropterin-6-yl-methyl-4-(beta-D-ribofuranosyl)aminobenzene 5'-phosphate synthase
MRPVDRLEVLVLVDNVTDSLSTTPKFVIPEWSGLVAAGRMTTLSGEAICRAHHGLSLLLTAHVGDERHTLLIDAGPAGSTLTQNAVILGVPWGEVEAVVLSHGHWDHGGGLLTALETIALHRSPGKLDCFVHPGMFGQRATQRPDGILLVQERLPGPERLAKAGSNVVNTREAQTAVGGVFYVSGEVPRVTPYEVGLPGHMRRSGDGRTWEPDPLIMDERFVSVQVKGKGQLVFSACSHAGIVNVLTHAQQTFPSVPLYAAMGGLHLSGPTEKIIPETVAGLKRFGLTVLAAGHCTGWRATSLLAREFPDALVPTAVGKKYLF